MINISTSIFCLVSISISRIAGNHRILNRVMSGPPIHPDPTTSPAVTDHPDTDPTYESDVNWGSLKTVAKSGIRIKYGGDYATRDSILGPPKGIGIWKRGSPNHRSWDGLLEIPLHLIVTRWVLSGVTFGLRLPLMGMPPREPTNMMMNEARNKIEPFSRWFVHATVIPARLLADFVNIDPKTATMELRGSWRDYNFSTGSPVDDMESDSVSEVDKSLDNLYYIQLLRNELPSYHFWSHTDPIQNGGEMRHGLIGKGVSACYDVDGDNVISNVGKYFSRLQNLPLRNTNSHDSERITNTDPHQSPTRGRNRSRSPRGQNDGAIYRNRSEEASSRRAPRASRPPRATRDIPQQPSKGKVEKNKSKGSSRK
jgi:hypothetical protein